MKIKATAKVAAVATSLAMAMSMLSFAPMAQAAALTAAQVSAITTLLQSFGADATTIANVNASLTGGAVTSAPALGIGSKGAAVTALQEELIAGGYLSIAKPTGYYGKLTAAAVAARAAATAATASTGGSTSTVPGCKPGDLFSGTTGQSCSATTTGATTGTGTTALTGTGRLTNISSYGSVYSDIKEGDATTAVVGVQADAVNGDVAIQRVDASFYVDDVGSQSSSLDQYVSDVSLYLNDTKLASMDPAKGDKSGRIWTMRFSGLNGVIKSGTTGNIVVKVTPLKSIGTNEDSASTVHGITVVLLANSIRAVGADGISDTYLLTSPTVTQGNSGVADTVTGGTIGGQQFHVSSATVGTLTVTAAGDNPTASQIAVASSTTTGVKLLSFNMKAKNSNVKVTDLVASFGTSDSLNDVVNTVYLMKGSQVLKSTTLGSGTYQTVTFSNVNDTITKDATNSYSLVADLKGDAAYPDGTTLVASTTITGWDVSDANGSSVTPSAAAVGNTQTLTATGISVTRGTPTNTVAAGLAGAGDIATMAIPFTVTAGDNDVYIGGTATKGSGNNAGSVTYATTTTSTRGATGEPTASLSVGSTVTGDSAGSYYKVLAGTSRTFTLTVAITATTTGATTAGFVGMSIGSIAYGAVAGTETSYYTSNLDTFKTSDMYVTKR